MRKENKMITEKEKLMNVFDDIGIEYEIDYDGEVKIENDLETVYFAFDSFAMFKEIYANQH